jgi:hypothetical protein
MKLHNLADVFEDTDSVLLGLSLAAAVAVLLVAVGVGLLALLGPPGFLGVLLVAAVCRVVYALLKGK